MPLIRGKDAKGPFFKWGNRGVHYHYKPGNKLSLERAKKKALNTKLHKFDRFHPKYNLTIMGPKELHLGQQFDQYYDGNGYDLNAHVWNTYYYAIPKKDLQVAIEILQNYPEYLYFTKPSN
jgi:hypothetical protein